MRPWKRPGRQAAGASERTQTACWSRHDSNTWRRVPWLATPGDEELRTGVRRRLAGLLPVDLDRSRNCPGAGRCLAPPASGRGVAGVLLVTLRPQRAGGYVLPRRVPAVPGSREAWPPPAAGCRLPGHRVAGCGLRWWPGLLHDVYLLPLRAFGPRHLRRGGLPRRRGLSRGVSVPGPRWWQGVRRGPARIQQLLAGCHGTP